MRLILACGLVLIAAAVVSGCGVELLTTTAVQGQLQAQQLTAIRGQVQNAAQSTGRINLERAIRTYQAEKGTYPPTLDVLAPDYIPAVPVKSDGAAYGYDPATGQLIDNAPASGIDPSDYQTLNQIRTAINQFGTDTGYYPGTLDALYPNYLQTLPRTLAGESFLYDNQSGTVTHPRMAAAQNSSQSAPQENIPTSGVGPMGETLTGIGVQQQLNSMNQSGTSAAGSYARQSIREKAATGDQRTNQAMDDLGL